MKNRINLYNFQNYDFFLKNVIAHYQYWPQNSHWQTSENGRPNNALMFFIGCKVAYQIEHETQTQIAEPGDIAIIPKEAHYSCTFDLVENIQDTNSIDNNLSNFYYNGEHANKMSIGNYSYNAIFVGFDLYDNFFNECSFTDKITIVKTKNPQKFLSRFMNIVSYSGRGISTPLSLNSSLYRLLNDMSNELQLQQSSFKDNALQPAIQYILENNIGDITVSKLSEVCNMSPSGFRSSFKKNMGVSPIDYISDLKIQKAQALLADSSISITDIAHNLGFSDVSYFSRFFRKQTGYSPSDVRQFEN